MEVKVRKERTEDRTKVSKIIEAAFKKEKYSDHTEHLMVERLRESKSYIPELSLIAEVGKKIVGHILLTKIIIEGKDRNFESLALAPVSVLPEYQNNGIGGHLIKEAHRLARELGFTSIILLGHADYYPRFNYVKASNFNISIPFEAPDENCMAIALVEKGLKGVSGVVVYDKAFYE